MVPYAQANAGTGELSLEYTLGGRTVPVSFSAPALQLELENLSGSSAALRIRNRSAAPVYVRIVVKGLPEEGEEPAIQAGLSIETEYRAAGRFIGPGDLDLGEDMEVRVTVRNETRRTIPEIALVHPLPASLELVNTRLAGENSGDSGASSFKYQDFRDDRVMTYFDLRAGESKTVSFRVNKTYGGTYYHPAIHAYAMYDESIRALEPGVKAGAK
jgi:uncharacterized protein YfaS (alpha-2-macroglobulin family)